MIYKVEQNLYPVNEKKDTKSDFLTWENKGIFEYCPENKMAQLWRASLRRAG